MGIGRMTEMKAESGPRLACFYVVRGPFAGTIVEVRRRTVVGRDPACDIALPDASISREHAIFIDDGMMLTVADVASTNGTFVNGEQITQPTELNVGDTVRLGSCELEFIERRKQRDFPAYRETRKNMSVEIQRAGAYSAQPGETTTRLPKKSGR